MAEQQASGSSAVSAQGTSTEDGSSFDLTTENLMRHIFERPDPLSKWMDLNFVDPLGFDVEDVFRKILTIGGDNYIKDTKLMVAFAVERGNNLENIATRSSADAISEIKRLISKYGLVTEATSPQSITLDRVCLAFPPLACNYMPLARKTVVDKKALLSVCSDYPLDMMHKAFATVIPNSLSEECQKTIVDAHCLHEAHYCAIIGRSKDGSSKKPRDYIESCRKMILNYKASQFTEELRLQCMENWNIIDENGNPTPPVVNAASKLHSLTADFLPTV